MSVILRFAHSLYFNTALKPKLQFQLIQVSGMELTQPQQVFCRMAEILLESKMTPAIAQASLTKFFLNKDKKRTSTILVIDEVNTHCNQTNEA